MNELDEEELDEEYQKGFDAAIKQFSWQTNLAEVFASPVTLAEEIQKFKDHNWTSAEWDLFCRSLQPFQDTLKYECAEAFEDGATEGFDAGESEGRKESKKECEEKYESELQKENEKAYDEGYEAAKKEFSHPINTPNSPKG